MEATFIIFLKEKISFEQAKFEMRNKPLFLKKGFRKEFIFFFLFFFFFFFKKKDAIFLEEPENI